MGGGKIFVPIYAQEVIPLDSPLPTPVISPYGQTALAFIAEKYAVPIEHLLIEYELETPYPLSGRTFHYFKIANTRDAQWTTYSLSVEPTTGAIEEDLTALEAAERAAYVIKYGKMEPALWARLQQVTDDTVLPVAIWVAGRPTRSEEEILAILAAEFPEAEKALAAGSKPIAVENSELSLRIQQRYEELINENISGRHQPVEAWLTEQGYSFERIEGMPSFTAKLPKAALQKLAQLDGVGLLYIIDAPMILEGLDIATASDRATTLWQRGLSGTGVKVAVLDENRINPNCLNIVATKDATLPLADHATKVANIIACNTGLYKGVAYNASIVDGGFAPNNDPAVAQTNLINSLKWATETPQYAKVVNASVGWNTGGEISWVDRAFDYWARLRWFTVAKSAGNNATYITSPGKAWNVITVGGSNTQGTVNWSDDDMYNSSNYIDPTGADSGFDREKPEIVAPAVNITTANGNAAPISGTSYAAPQVAGLAALLIQRNSNLSFWPEAIKAILMASAVHNIEGNRTLSEYDGAGAIDAALADHAAQIQQTSPTVPCNSACWWGIFTTSTSPSVGSSLNRYFNANKGERIRVAIAWSANADSDTNNYSFDRLDTDYDLRVYIDGGALVASSLSVKNNYEIVEFVATETTKYRIDVKKQAAMESYNSVAIAWVKQATYLPDVRKSNSGWTSSIYVRNEGTEPRPVRINFFDPNGSPNSVLNSPTNLQPNELWAPVPPNNWQGTAIVDGNEDLAVVIRNDATGQATLDNGFQAAGVVDPAFAQPATTLYGPAIYVSNSGGLNSSIYLYNPNANTVNGTLNLLARSGSSADLSPIPFSLLKNGSTTILLGGPTWVGSLKLTANLPVIAKVTEGQGTTVMRSYNATATGNQLINVAAVYKNDLNFSSSGLVIQNLHLTTATTAQVTYCNRLNSTCYTETTPSIPPERAYGINVATTTAISAAMWNGSVKIQSQNNLPLAVAVTNAKSVGGYDISGINPGSRLIVLPRAVKNAGGRISGFTVFNVSNENNVNVTVTHYDTNGNALCPFSFSLNAAQSNGYYQSYDTCLLALPATWEGSIVLEATRPIIAIMREDTSSTTAGYNGVAR